MGGTKKTKGQIQQQRRVSSWLLRLEAATTTASTASAAASSTTSTTASTSATATTASVEVVVVQAWGLPDGSGAVFLGLQNLDDIGLQHGNTVPAGGVMRLHDGDTNAKHTLPHVHMPDGTVDVMVGDGTGTQHVSILELHHLGTLGSELARNHNFHTLGSVLHDEPDHTIGGTAHGQTSQQLVAHRLGLSQGAQGPVVDTFGKQLDAAFLKLPALLHQAGEFSDAPALLAKHILGPGGTDDDFGTSRSHPNFNTSISILGEFTLKEIIQFGIKDAVGDKLALLGDGGGHSFWLTLSVGS
mmetsp:Transcript_84588/g.117554  ORF Transcript_84588/g.117554 Transcript_84588/m.117554 type:complete len:300 (+) Transcript_84588:60-959(+)